MVLDWAQKTIFLCPIQNQGTKVKTGEEVCVPLTHFGFVTSRFGFVWSGPVRFGPVCSGSVWFGLVWSGCRENGKES